MSSSLDAFNESLQLASNPLNPPPARPPVLDLARPTSSLNPDLADHWHYNSQFTPPNTAINSNGIMDIHKNNKYNSPPQADTSHTGELPQSRVPAFDRLFSEVDEDEVPNFDDTKQEDDIFHMSRPAQQPAELELHEHPSPSLHSKADLGPVRRHLPLTDVPDFTEPGSHPSPTESQLVAEGFEFHSQLPEDVQINRFNDKAVRKALREVSSGLSRKQQWYAWNKAKEMLDTEPDTAAAEQTGNGWQEPLDQQDEHRYEFKRANGQPNELQYEQQHEQQPASGKLTDAIWAPPCQINFFDTSIDAHNSTEDKQEHNLGNKWAVQPPPSQTPSSPASTGGFAFGRGGWHASKAPINQDRLTSKPLGSVIKKIAEQHRIRRESTCNAMNNKDTQQRETKDAAAEEERIHPLNPCRPRPRQDCIELDDTPEIATKRAELAEIKKECDETDQAVSNNLDLQKPTLLEHRDCSARGLVPHDKQQPVADTQVPASSTATKNHLTPLLSPRPTVQDEAYSNGDLFRLHTTTSTQRSLSHSRSHSDIPPPLNPSRRSPSPWIEHPGINRPDTPRPLPQDVSQHASPLRGAGGISSIHRECSPLRNTSSDTDVRQSVEPETPSHTRIRERDSTPAFENRSPSPSPVSHQGSPFTATHGPPQEHSADTVMTDAPPIPRLPTQHYFPASSSPDPLSSPLIHGGNTVTAPQSPCPPFTPSRFIPPPIPSEASSPIKLAKRGDKPRRKSVGGQTPSSTPRPRIVAKGRNATAVQGAKVNKPKPEAKSSSVTRNVTQVAQKVKKEAADLSKTHQKSKISGSKVADAVAKIEANAEGSPRRSGRIAKMMMGGRQ